MGPSHQLHEQAQRFLDRTDSDDDRNPDVELSQLGGAETLNGERIAAQHYRLPSQTKASPLLVGLALLFTVLGFVINTEATEYFESLLGWKKPFATLYITHSALALPWLCHVLYLRYQNRHSPYVLWAKDYNNRLREAISTIDAYTTDGPRMIWKLRGQLGGPLDFLATAMAIVTLALTVSGVAWFLGLTLTTPADLTAIYNCSTFFAAAFSVPLLKEKLGRYSVVAVALSIVGTFIIAYGDTTAEHPLKEDSAGNEVGTSRLLGNLIACVGALAFGLYEVLFKKWACSSRPVSPQQSMPLTLAASGLLGLYTFATLWVGLVLLHIFGIETFVWPRAEVWLWIVIAVLSGSMSINLLAVLVVWTDPVFGSFANVLSVFFVALADWILFGLTPSFPTYVGGGVVIVAFALLSWDTFRHQR
ncbi:hypothetical protein BAUCODRAFT_33463 [Baudoinia panamericana UAMH 10762]|uniref:Uncharacterized protein n=1 Tax=Baudoinia panamericana (strain UAMH 10762) TaxID=717646 RepID=M2LT86_BAUPA|nr:uncharacterized protein BAUCODRAFT_33463 [Baudoinia panamericana UAMH 10762]EMC97737.1 hypothetical protein BAUCODRAFT_33463 [Baudoinia panamericana UAMH 10762]